MRNNPRLEFRSHPGPGRRVIVIASAILLGITAISVGAIPAPATAAPASTPSVDFQGNTPRPERSWVYGASSPATRQILIGPETTTIQVISPVGIRDTDMCYFYNDTTQDYFWYSNIDGAEQIGQPDPGQFAFDFEVPAGSISANLTDKYRLQCEINVFGSYYFEMSSVIWNLDANLNAPRTVLLNTSSTKLVEQSEELNFISDQGFPDSPYATTGTDQVVQAGNRIRMYAEAGTWRQATPAPTLNVTFHVGGISRKALDVNVTSDGSILGFTVPSDIPASYAGSMNIDAKSVTVIPGTTATAKRTNSAEWSDRVIYEPTPVSKKLTSTPTPTITGTPRFGSTLAANTTAWAPSPVTLQYQWMRGTSPIKGATSSTYKLTTADVKTAITVAVTGTKTGYTTVTKTSAAKTIAPNVLTATPKPTVTGTAKAGSTLRATVGTWSPSPVTLAYQWKRNGTTIPGATTATLKLTTADKGKSITFTVTGSRPGYTTVTTTSSPKVVSN